MIARRCAPCSRDHGLAERWDCFYGTPYTALYNRAVNEPRDPHPVPRAVDLLGWYGTLAILSAYALSNFDLLEKGALYQLLNLTGALGVGLVCWYRRTWQAFWLEAVWGLIALVALVS